MSINIPETTKNDYDGAYVHCTGHCCYSIWPATILQNSSFLTYMYNFYLMFICASLLFG